MPAPKNNKNAEKEINWKAIEALLMIGCTGEEIAQVLGVNYDTIQNHCKKEKGMLFSEYIKKGTSGFKISLRRLQLRSAKKGSVAMLIWLGKQFLDQKDKQELTGKEGEPLNKIIVEVVNTKN